MIEKPKTYLSTTICPIEVMNVERIRFLGLATEEFIDFIFGIKLEKDAWYKVEVKISEINKND